MESAAQKTEGDEVYDDEFDGYEYEDDYDDELEIDDDEEEEWEMEYAGDAESPFTPEEEAELAAELLEIDDDEELEQFLGSLIGGAAKTIGGLLSSPVGRTITSAVKSVAKRALPWVGRKVGGWAGGRLGGWAGGRVGGRRGRALGRRYGSRYGRRAGGWLAQRAGRWLGLELEGLSPEIAEFEVAKKIVRLAGAAGKKAAQSKAPEHPVKKAKKALIAAARRHAPGVVKKLYSAPLRPRPFTIGRKKRCLAVYR